MLKREQWLIEADAGTLQMRAEVREAREGARYFWLSKKRAAVGSNVGDSARGIAR
jgi:hypothetical protein